MMKGKKFLIGITGSIAAYKTISLVRLLVKAGAEVKVVMTDAAKSFVSPLVLSTLSRNKVLSGLFEEDEWSNHVALGRWADVFIIAPLSCNTLAKMALGQCDNLLLATYLSATCPVVVAPAMDEDMWLHGATKRNIALLQEDKVTIIDVDKGDLASGLNGPGRMAEPEAIFSFIEENYCRDTILQGKKVLVTAGPTYEEIDPVRFIGNYSSGKMGFAIANAFYENGADVILVTGPSHEKTAYKGIKIIAVKNSDEMFNACIQHSSDCDIIVMSAAVADFKPATKADRKIKKTSDNLLLELVATKDILHHLGHHKKEQQFIAGFALETNNEKENALKKLQFKNIDCIILNSLNNPNTAFGYDTNTITIIDHQNEIQFTNKSKKEVADDIVAYITSKITF
jgi:phosphopantothenoylcysteine decarboxylase/phosphopantothenate--cysteine ligase